MEAFLHGFGEKSASPALTVDDGCRGGHVAVEGDKGQKWVLQSERASGPGGRYGMRR